MRFYVYELIDPRTSRVFYVGKGTGSRVFWHEKAARAGDTGEKCALIREILAAGGTVQHRIARRFSDENDAYAFEAERIREIGLTSLTNVAPGGGEARPFVWTASKIRHRAKEIRRLVQVVIINQQRLWIGPYEITEILRDFIARIVRDVGVERFTDLLKENAA